MAKYVTDSEFKRLVRVCLDENMSSEALEALEDADTLTLDDIIDSKIEDAALTVVRIAPIDKLGDVAQSLEGALSISGEEPHKCVIQLPVDFERLVRFKMRSWQYAVFTALPPLSPLYIEANSEFGVCGTKDRPLVFLVPSTENGKDLCLEVFSAKNSSDVLDGCLYVARPKKEVVSSDAGMDDSGVNNGSNGNNGSNIGGDGENSGDTYYEGFIGHIGHIDEDGDGIITCSEAIEICNSLPDNEITEEEYSVMGYVREIDGDASEGKQTFWISDALLGDNTIKADKGHLPEGVDSLEEGMKVIVAGALNKYVDLGAAAVILIDEGEVVVLDEDDDVPVPEYVDLGLPSGTLWATMNIGAKRPWDSGDYFAWGETGKKETYFWSDYLFGNGALHSISKYNTTDGKTELDTEDDAATVILGRGWQIPTRAQLLELVNSQYTTVEWTAINGVNGHLITSKENGNSIFLPATGDIVGAAAIGVGTYGKYWSCTLNFGKNTNIEDACILHTLQYGCAASNSLRYEGLCIRPIFAPSNLRGRKKVRVESSGLSGQDGLSVQPSVEVNDAAASGDSWKLLIGERLLSPTIYYTAHLTALTLNDNDAAEKLLGIAKSLIET